jgi:hypothetical protein
MALFRHNLNCWFINLGLYIISWGVLYWDKYTLVAQIAECANVGDWYEKCQST